MATYTSGQTTDTTVLANATIDRYLYRSTLEIAKKTTVLYNLGKKVKVPKGNSKTISFTRFERLALPLAPLTEGTTPNATPMSTTRVTCVLEQWGAWISLTDVTEMTVTFDAFQEGVEKLGLQAAETVDREVLRVLLGGTQVFFPGSITARSGITPSDVPTTNLLRKVRATLKNNGAPFTTGQKFMGVADPFNSGDIMADSTFLQTAVYQDKTPLMNGEFGEWMGIRWMESNVLPVLVLNATTNATLGAASPAGAEVALADATYTVQITGNDASGFETNIWATQTQATTSQVVTVATPALPTGVTSFNIYVSTAGGGAATLALQAERVGASVTKRILGSGSSATGIVLDSTAKRGFVAPATGVNVHYMFVFGSEYYAVTELEAIRTIRTPRGPDKSDPLDQQTPIGWKTMFKACILNHNFGCRIEAESAFD